MHGSVVTHYGTPSWCSHRAPSWWTAGRGRRHGSGRRGGRGGVWCSAGAPPARTDATPPAASPGHRDCCRAQRFGRGPPSPASSHTGAPRPPTASPASDSPHRPPPRRQRPWAPRHPLLHPLLTETGDGLGERLAVLVGPRGAGLDRLAFQCRRAYWPSEADLKGNQPYWQRQHGD